MPSVTKSTSAKSFRRSESSLPAFPCQTQKIGASARAHAHWPGHWFCLREKKRITPQPADCGVRSANAVSQPVASAVWSGNTQNMMAQKCAALPPSTNTCQIAWL